MKQARTRSYNLALIVEGNDTHNNQVSLEKIIIGFISCCRCIWYNVYNNYAGLALSHLSTVYIVYLFVRLKRFIVSCSRFLSYIQ